MKFFEKASENPALLALLSPLCSDIRSCSLLIEFKMNITETLAADLLHDLQQHYHVRVFFFCRQADFLNRVIME
jgi:hypothetical protein